jgi:CheY-like chemotaxis protein
LQQAQKLESVGRLAGGVAHDFNNLLTVINGYSGLLLKRLDHPNDPLENGLEQIRQAGERAAGLTQQLLAFSRHQLIEPRPLSANAVLADAERMLQRIVGEDIEFITRLHASPGLVMADPVQIHQVLMNLVVNARDAMPNGGKVIIETMNVDVDERYRAPHLELAPGPYVLLSVTDTGIGMDEPTRLRVFEPFFTTKEKGIGTGLGLSTVYGIVRQAGGCISVYSEPGLGTTFKVYLPRLAEGAPAEATDRPGSSGLQGSETVLVVEDQEEVRRLAAEVLRTYGYNVIQAATGLEALQLAEHYSGRIDLVLTDVVMPGMAGPELIDRFRALQPGIKVLCMSGYTADAAALLGVLDSGVAFISKPFAPDVLAAEVRAILGSKASPDVIRA